MVNYQIIPIEVLSTDHGYNCAYTITQGDTNAYILKITYTDITEFDGTVTLRFTFPDGTYSDRENVVIDGNTITYTMDETDYSQRNVSVFVRHTDSTIIHTTLKIKFSNIRALPGNAPTTEIKSYPEWAADMIDYDIAVGTVETLAPGADATASITGDVPDKLLNLGIPKGDKGEAATVAVGTVTTLDAGESATVANSGASAAAVLDFGIPKGDKGDAGEMTIGTVTTLAPGESATVTNSGTSTDAVLDIGIPAGYDGSAVPVDDASSAADRVLSAGYIKGQLSAIDAQLAEKVQNFKLKNEVVNGDFSNGLTDWGGGEIIEDDIVKAGYRIYQITGVSLGLNKIYLRAKVRVRSSPTPGTLYMGFTGSIVAQQTYPVINQWYNISFIHVANKTSNVMQIAMNVPDALIDVDKNFGVLMVDLTTIFGVGNEPTKLEMDELMKVIPNGWWDGELSLTQKQFITWQLNLIRKNTNAIIALGGTIV